MKIQTAPAGSSRPTADSATLSATRLVRGIDRRTKSLIVTIFGDTIAPHGGSVWLGSLVTAMTGFGVHERAVRTAVSRLVNDGWLDRTGIGRRSYYRLTDDGLQQFDHATQRIYGTPTRTWHGDWHMVVAMGAASDVRDRLRRELGWQGFAAMAPGIFARPAADRALLDATLRRLGLDNDVVIFESRHGRDVAADALTTMVTQLWPINTLAVDYTQFLQRFQPLWRVLASEPQPDAKTAFVIRTLLIHDYRRVMLRDPLLPVELLPSGWPGMVAWSLSRHIYDRIWRAAEGYAEAAFESLEGPLPKVDASFFRRFGGLTPRSETNAA